MTVALSNSGSARCNWVSRVAELAWSDKFALTRTALYDAQIGMVVDGRQKYALLVLLDESMDDLSASLETLGLTARKIDLPHETFVGACRPGTRGLANVIVGRPVDVNSVSRQCNEQRAADIAEGLGAPECCHDFILSWSPSEDIEWAIASRSAGGCDSHGTIAIDSQPSTNIFWRHFGLWPAPFFPCRFDCEAAAGRGSETLSSLREAGFADEAAWLQEILGWPLNWSSLFGTCEIENPVMRLLYSGPRSAERRCISYSGRSYPEQGVLAKSLGLVFKPSNSPEGDRHVHIAHE